jgi:acyl-CoA thioester hydrolase
VSMNSPIIYDGFVEARFSELDPYGHVNSKHFLDYVISTRWSYLEKKLKMTSDELIKKGLGFFLKRSEINYKKPVAGGMLLYVSSHVEKAEDATLVIHFKIQDEGKQKLFADGELHFAVMDLVKLRPQALPEWVHEYFYKP